jgi:hypothetical protein
MEGKNEALTNALQNKIDGVVVPVRTYKTYMCHKPTQIQGGNQGQIEDSL